MRLRRGRAGDLGALAALVLREKMNPLFLEPSRFVVGVEEDGTLVGGGQIRAVGPPEAGADELASVVVRADRRGQSAPSFRMMTSTRWTTDPVCFTTRPLKSLPPSDLLDKKYKYYK